MIPRHAEAALKRLAQQFPVIGITGPRQSGKSTLAKLAFPNKKYITFDDEGYRKLANESPQEFLLAFPDGLIIDEAQKVPKIFDALKYFVDQGEYIPGKYVLTGSSQFKLRHNMTESLAGRAAFIRLLPFSLGELEESRLLPGSPYDLVLQGLYPPIHDVHKHFIKEDWFNAYVESYLERDVAELVNSGNISTFCKFLKLCAVYSGQILSMNSLSKAVGVSAPTIKSWLSVLENSYIIHFLQLSLKNLGKALVRSPKMYFVDSGLLCYLLGVSNREELLLSPYKGAIVESFAVAELLKHRFNQGQLADLSFYRDRNGFEVDVIAEWKKLLVMEIKSSISPSGDLAKGVKRYLELISDKDASGAVFYFGNDTITTNNVTYVAYKEWYKYLCSF